MNDQANDVIGAGERQQLLNRLKIPYCPERRYPLHGLKQW